MPRPAPCPVGQTAAEQGQPRSAAGKGLVRVESRRCSPPRQHSGSWLLQAELTLNAQQRARVRSDQRRPWWFSGLPAGRRHRQRKTEVYLQLIHRVLAAGKQALVLIPEINLGPQTLAREQRFNARIALLHSTSMTASGSTPGSRPAMAKRTSSSAPAQPVHADEESRPDHHRREHDASYKQQEGLRYHARDLAWSVLARKTCRSCSARRRPLWKACTTPTADAMHYSG